MNVCACFLVQVACALWRLLADSAQVPVSTTRPLGSHTFRMFFVSFRFVLVHFRVSRCFLAQVVCALWRLLVDSAPVPFSTAGPLGSHKFGYFLNHVGKSLFRVMFSDASCMFLETGGLCNMASACGFRTSSLFNRRTTRLP